MTVPAWAERKGRASLLPLSKLQLLGVVSTEERGEERGERREERERKEVEKKERKKGGGEDKCFFLLIRISCSCSCE